MGARWVAAAMLAVCAWGAALAAEDEFTPLFNGKDLAGWEIMNGGKFAAEGGVIKLSGGSGWLRSEGEYADFILRVELRFLKKNQDSGVFLRASKEGKGWPNKRIEVQCHNDKSMARLFGPKHELKADVVAKVLKETDDWNQYEIKCVGPRIEVRLNGELVTTSDSAPPGTGHIGLQGENGFLEFRNLSIKKVAP